MKLYVFLICLMGLMATAPDASAQSFLNKVKRAVSKTAQEAVQKTKQDAVNKAKQEVEQKTNLKVTPEVVNNKPTARKSIGKTLSGKSSSSAGSHTLPFPKDHTALFEPLGYPCDPTWGTKQHTLSKPPHDLTKQPDWMSARPAEVEYDNASLVKAFEMLDECMETKYLTAISPAAFGFSNMLGELEARCKALNAMVNCYTAVMDEYENFYEDDGMNHGVMLDEAKDNLCNALKNDHYKSTIRSSIAPLKKYLESKTVEYFEKHGGLENAHKAKFTVVQEAKKSTVSTTTSGQTGTVEYEGSTGAHIDIDGITYIIHFNKGAAFASEVVEMAVRGKDVVMPDYINYKGRRFPVKDMRASLFMGKNIKSIKLPATLEEIRFRTFMRSGISEVVIPSSVKIISGAAFADCKNLKKVVFEGDRMDELSGCFQRCTALQNVTLPRNVGKMSGEMFSGCTNLTSVRLPDNLKELPNDTFKGCAKLTTVTVPASVTKMGSDVFDGSGVVSLDLSHVMEFDEFGSIGCCANLKNLKLNAKLKNAPVNEVYEQVQDCPHLVPKFVNGKYVYPAGLLFVNTK